MAFQKSFVLTLSRAIRPRLAPKIPSRARLASQSSNITPQNPQLDDKQRTAKLEDKETTAKLEDKEQTTVINVVWDEYSKSGGDHVVAEQKVASFHPGDTQPQSIAVTAGKKITINPLEMSPANLEASKFTIEKDVHPERNVDKIEISKRVSPRKSKAVDQYDNRGGAH